MTVDGLRLRVSVARQGAGTPLVLIGGIGAPLELWEPFRRALSTETLAVDLPGVGGSATLRRPRSMWGVACILDRLLDQLDYPTVDVLGVSWGGGVAQYLALRRRSRVRLLILASTGFGLWSMPGDPRALVHLLMPARYFSKSHFLQIAPTLYGGETGRHPERLPAQAVVRSATRPSAIGYVHQLAATATWVALPLLPLIRTETLVLNGGDDPIVHVATARIMAAALPYGRLRIVRGGGHMFLLDQPREAADIVGSFLRSGL